MVDSIRDAPGWPGISPRWTSSAKTGVRTALSASSQVWFTLSHGIFNEIYHPRIDQACTRDMGLIVTDGWNFFSEEKRHTRSMVRWSTDRWHTVHDNRTRDTGLGIHVFDVPADGLLTGTMILFTFYWPETGQWEGADFVVAVE